MKTRQEKIDAIYEKIADKTLSFGCRIILVNQEIIMETDPYEGHYSEYYEANGIITGRYGTETIEGTTLQIEKIYFYEPFYNENAVSDAFTEEFVFDEEYEAENNNLKIIGHPVMIGDVMNFLEIFSKNKIINVGYVIKHWMIKTMPIEEQDDECVEFVYNLISQ